MGRRDRSNNQGNEGEDASDENAPPQTWDGTSEGNRPDVEPGYRDEKERCHGRPVGLRHRKAASSRKEREAEEPPSPKVNETGHQAKEEQNGSHGARTQEFNDRSNP